MHRGNQSGFSLIETLVAMTVLSVSATAILSATETHTHTVTAVTERTVALWVAQNSMIELEEGRKVPDTIRMGHMAWQVRADRAATNDPDLGRFDLSVAPASTPDTVLARLTGFFDVARGATE
ncbi:MAG: type II secretion system minor pseudopilin GspI [Pseudomonadota bacterium]